MNGKDGVAGSIPAGGSTKPLTSRNAGRWSSSGSLGLTTSPNWNALGGTGPFGTGAALLSSSFARLVVYSAPPHLVAWRRKTT
jgi:hypothetical protein